MSFVVDEIFELGYSMYIKNLIKSDLNNGTNDLEQKKNKWNNKIKIFYNKR